MATKYNADSPVAKRALSNPNSYKDKEIIIDGKLYVKNSSGKFVVSSGVKPEVKKVEVKKPEVKKPEVKVVLPSGIKSGVSVDGVKGTGIVNQASPSNGKPTVDSEIVRAKQVWADAEKLAGTGKYVGKTADQIKADAHAYAESLRNGGPIQADQGIIYPSGSKIGARILAKPNTSDFPVVTVDGITYHKDANGNYVDANNKPPVPPKAVTPDVPEVKTPLMDPAINKMSYEEALKQLEADPNFKLLPESLKSLFRETLKTYDYNKELNVESVLKEFNRIKTETIDPRFSKEINKFTNDLNKEYETLAVQRDIEKETLNANAGKDIRQAKAGLEKAGMTFTGQGIEQLGADSAYAQPGAQNVAMPVQTGFGGLFNEGTVNQASRLMASSAANRYQSQLTNLGQQAENVLGGKGATGIIPGYVPSGNLPGSVADNQQEQYGKTLSGILGQKYQDMNNDQNLDYKFPQYNQ